MSRNLVEIVRRHHEVGAPTALEVLKEAMERRGEITDEDRRVAAERSGLPEAAVHDGAVSLAQTVCLGFCHASPAIREGDVIDAGAGVVDRVLAGAVQPAAEPTLASVLPGGPQLLATGRDWEGLERALTTVTPEELLAQVTEAEVRGRGGAGFPDEFPLVLVTGRRLEHYNAGTMTRRTGNLDLLPSDWLELHPVDAARLWVGDGDLVSVRSVHGRIELPARMTERIEPGHVFTTFHFPEIRTNRLIGSSVDANTSCPEYKVVAVDVRPVAEQASRTPAIAPAS